MLRLPNDRRIVYEIQYAATAASAASIKPPVSVAIVPTPPNERAIPVAAVGIKAHSGANSLLALILPISLSSHLAQPIAIITAIYLKLSEGFNNT